MQQEEEEEEEGGGGGGEEIEPEFLSKWWPRVGRTR